MLGVARDMDFLFVGSRHSWNKSAITGGIMLKISSIVVGHCWRHKSGHGSFSIDQVLGFVDGDFLGLLFAHDFGSGYWNVASGSSNGGVNDELGHCE